MKCPRCEKKLVADKKRVFDTLIEHVCDPNYVAPPRMTFVCPDKCGGSFYNHDGEGYAHDKEFYAAKDSCAWAIR